MMRNNNTLFPLSVPPLNDTVSSEVCSRCCKGGGGASAKNTLLDKISLASHILRFKKSARQIFLAATSGRERDQCRTLFLLTIAAIGGCKGNPSEASCPLVLHKGDLSCHMALPVLSLITWRWWWWRIISARIWISCSVEVGMSSLQARRCGLCLHTQVPLTVRMTVGSNGVGSGTGLHDGLHIAGLTVE